MSNAPSKIVRVLSCTLKRNQVRTSSGCYVMRQRIRPRGPRCLDIELLQNLDGQDIIVGVEQVFGDGSLRVLR